LAAAVVALVLAWDWNWFRGPVERIASARLHRQVTIAGDLNADVWSWTPKATFDGVTIANPAWAGRGDLGAIGRLAVQVRLLPLFIGRVDMPELRVERPRFDLVADAQGRRNWDFSDGREAQPMKLPPIHRFIVRDGRIRYVDSRRNIRFEGTVNAHETLGGGRRGFELVGRGTINREPFRAEISGGPLLNVQRTKPYPFEAEIHAGPTIITARGAVPKPFDLGHFHLTATAQGRDLADLFPLTGVVLPNTPPYDLRGRLVRDGLVWKLNGIGGRVGDSDLSGALSVTTGRERPYLQATLASRSLDFDDLAAVFGGAPSAGKGETASAEQAAIGRKLAAQQRLLPDTTLNVRRIRAMDADVTYQARSIRDAPVKLTAGRVRVKLDDGLLRARDLRLDLPQGRLEGRVDLDARRAVPKSDLDVRMVGARIEQLLPLRFDGDAPLSGGLLARARLSGQGDSVHKAFANADGEVVVVAPGGEIRQGVAELLGVNVIKGLGLLHDDKTTPVRCALARFKAQDGILRADEIVFDTGPVLVTGKGEVNLATERMDFRFKGHDKKLRIGRVLLPIKATGPITAPKLGVEPAAAIAQGGLGAALGSLLSPLAAILPFVDPGLADDANCGALLADARRAGAPSATASR
jgi:uncharacterized protein involved in outer membrane biogenesis